MIATLESSLLALNGLTCWGAVAGPGTGSHVTLHFGEKLPRKVPLNGSRTSEALRRYSGEYILFIQDCAWRMDESERMVCSSKSPNDIDGPMVTAFASAVSSRIVAADCAPSTYDLTLSLSSGQTIRLFCDCFDQENDGSNWSLHTPHSVFVVNAMLMLKQEPRNRP